LRYSHPLPALPAGHDGRQGSESQVIRKFREVVLKPRMALEMLDGRVYRVGLDGAIRRER
jgi:hypothetical protein